MKVAARSALPGARSDPVEAVGLRLREPRARHRGAGEIAVHGVGAGEAEQRAAAAARRERVEVAVRLDHDAAGEHRLPAVGGLIERVQAQRPERRPGVPAFGRPRRRVVEALARAVEVVDGDRRGVGCGRHDADEAEGERRAGAVPDGSSASWPTPSEPPCRGARNRRWALPSAPTVAVAALRKRPCRSTITPPPGAGFSTSPWCEVLKAGSAGDRRTRQPAVAPACRSADRRGSSCRRAPRPPRRGQRSRAAFVAGSAPGSARPTIGLVRTQTPTARRHEDGATA